MPSVTPVLARPQDVAVSGATRTRITAEEPVLAGHYPDFPIFPGVCVVECVLASALTRQPGDTGRLELASLESVRLLGAVFPGDDLDVTFEWSSDATGWRCVAKASTSRGDAASVKARFREVCPS